MNKIKTLSLFSGAGGLDIGFHKAGFDIIGCVEIEKQYCNTLTENRNQGNYFNRDAQIFCQDIREFDATQFIHSGIECVIGGPPCQPFSAAGRRVGGVPGIQDERGMLFESYCNVLSIIKPKVFIFENVYGLKGANNGEPWRKIVNSFSVLGYSIKAEILDAADYGVAQHRERLILVGTLESEFEFPDPTNGPDSRTGDALISIWDVVKDLPEEKEVTQEPIGGMYGHLLPLVPEGLNYSFFTKEMGYPEPYFAWRSKFHDFLYKADRNKPSRTLKAQPGKFTGPFHWNNRHFTINELKRIQSFPDNYVITGNNNQIIAQIGNSVPPQLAYILAMSIKEQILRPVDKLTYPVRTADFKSTFRKRQRLTSEYYKAVAKKEIEKRFGLNTLEEKQCYKAQRKYSVGYKNKFNMIMLNSKYIHSEFEYSYDVKSNTNESHMDITVLERKVNHRNLKVELSITGLEKYLLKIDSAKIVAEISCIDEIFSVWDVLQKELIDMSQFYSLIDIYGHYANRGDTVKVTTWCEGCQDKLLQHAINYFGDSSNCGIYLKRDKLSTDLGISVEDVDELVYKMRSMRYDVRIAATHPTIRTEDIICTYPFPMLSERVLFEKNK